MGLDMYLSLKEDRKNKEWEDRRACDICGMKEDKIYEKDELGKRPLYLCYRHDVVKK